MALESGPWQTRVSFAPDGSFAYRPGEVLILETDEDMNGARRILFELAKQRGLSVEHPPSGGQPEPVGKGHTDHAEQSDSDDGTPQEPYPTWDAPGSFTMFKGVPDTLEAIKKLNQAGIYAQPNHVVFAHTSPMDAGGGLQANPFYANPFYANPFYANPFYANPFYANPFYANPFYANPFYANPFYANPSPVAAPSIRETGHRPSSARPTTERPPGRQLRGHGIRIAVLDTAPGEKADGDDRGYLDPVAGHGKFIKGIIDNYAQGCVVEPLGVLTNYGDGDEAEIATALEGLIDEESDPKAPALVNLSFGGYSAYGMGALAEAIAKLHDAGAIIVASAGNDASPAPMYPAAMPYVIAVGALDHEGNPAPFTNYGPWVRACALGVEVVSTFFDGFEGDHPTHGGFNIDNFIGSAIWSGTSFAAPMVVAALAVELAAGRPRDDAVRTIVDGVEGESVLERKPLLGVVVDSFGVLNREEKPSGDL